MPLIKANEIKEKLNKFEELSSFSNLICWKKVEINYNIYIFSIQLKNEEELVKTKDDLRDYLAIYFQSQMLEKDIERWNIYQVFFIEEEIRLDIKLQIEQDKFATRKLVFDNVGAALSDQEIISRINTEIFNFSIHKNTLITNSLLDDLNDEDHKVLSAIEKANGNISNLLIQLCDE